MHAHSLHYTNIITYSIDLIWSSILVKYLEEDSLWSSILVNSVRQTRFASLLYYILFYSQVYYIEFLHKYILVGYVIQSCFTCIF